MPVCSASAAYHAGGIDIPKGPEDDLLAAADIPAEEYGPNILDDIQICLDIIGTVPVLGMPADLANTVVSLARGDWLGAGLNALGIIPFFGDAAKLMLKGGALASVAGTVYIVSRRADTVRDAVRAGDILAGGAKGLISPPASNAIGGLSRNLVEELRMSKDVQRGLMRAAMNSNDSGKVAHHLIPLEAESEFMPLLQRAAKGGFDINGPNNGILLDAAEHVGGHPIWNRVVLDELRDIGQKSGELSDGGVAELLQDCADTLRKAIMNGSVTPWG